MEKYQRTLSHPEARHRYWHIKKEDREFFPESLQIFKLKFDGKTYDLKVNHKDDVMTGQLYERLRFLEGNRIIVTRKKSDLYELEAPDTEPYPDL